MMERGGERTETDSRTVMERSRHGNWEMIPFLRGVFSKFVLGSSIYTLLPKGFHVTPQRREPPSLIKEGGQRALKLKP